MQLTLTGHHIEVTPPLRDYVRKKLDRVMRHFEQVIDVHCVLTVEKLVHKAEATLGRQWRSDPRRCEGWRHVRRDRRAR